MRTLSIIAVACALAYSNLARAQAPDASQAPQPELVPPKLVQKVEPVYPEAERSSGAAASVVLTLTIDREGHVSEAVVTDSGGPDFDAAAITAAQSLVFEPALKNGEPVIAKIRYRFDFQLAAPEPPAPVPTPAPPTTPSAPPPPNSAPNAAETAAQSDALEVDVQGQKPPREPTKHELSAEEISRIPGTNGDALRSLGNLPGVARPPGLSGLLIVRGSAAQDTQIFVDGTNVPIIYHFGGLSSVIPSEMLEKIDFYPGNFGPEYGRASGGIVDVGVRSPRKDRLGGLLQFDLIDGRVLAEGPINDSTRFLIAGRRSWLDAWLGPALRAGGTGVSVAPVYYDYQAMLEHDLTRDTTLRVFGFGSDDLFRITLNSPNASDPTAGGAAGEHSRFWRAQARLDTRASSTARWTTTFSVGQDAQRFDVGNIMFDYTLFSIDGRSDLRARVAPGITAVAGIDSQWSSYDVTARVPPVNSNSNDTGGPLYGRPLVELTGTGSWFRPAGYAMLELEPVTGFKLYPGIRGDYGSDTKKWTADPRLGLRYDVHAGFPRTTLKGGVGLYHQPPQPNESIAPFGTPGVGSLSALQTSVGVEQEITRPLELSFELYYKKLDDLVVPVAAATTAQSGTSYQNIGSGRSYGSELLLRYKPEGRFFGWLAYTLSRSERRDGPGEPLHVYDFDQTHILTAVASYKLGRGWQVGGRFRYVTGNPYTPDIGGIADYDSGAYAPIASANTNSARMASFNQLDLRVDKEWQFKAWKLSAYLDVQNVYNRQNPEGIAYNYNYSKTGIVSGLPLLPIIGVRGEL